MRKKHQTIILLLVASITFLASSFPVYAKYIQSFESHELITISLHPSQDQSIIEDEQYILLEYLEVKEIGVYIHTNIKYDPSWGMDVAFSMGNPTGSQYIVGAREGVGGDEAAIALAATGQNTETFEIWYQNTTSYQTVHLNRIRNNKYLFTSYVSDYKLHATIIDTSTQDSVSTIITPDTNNDQMDICIFGISPSCVATQSTRIYSVIFKDSLGNEALHFVPVAKRIEGGYEYGMYCIDYIHDTKEFFGCSYQSEGGKLTSSLE